MKEGNVLSYGFILGLLNWDYTHTNPPIKENTRFVKRNVTPGEYKIFSGKLDKSRKETMFLLCPSCVVSFKSHEYSKTQHTRVKDNYIFF